MPKQLNIAYGKPKNYNIENFYVDENNLFPNPLDIVLKPDVWNNNVLLIYGESGSGKTHLCHIYSQKFNSPIIDGNLLNMNTVDEIAGTGCVIDGIDDVDEELLFHLINAVKKTGAKLVFTTDKKVKDMNIKLPDLQSRLLQAMFYSIEKPSDDALRFVLLKNLMDRQLDVKPDVISYIIKQMPRSYSGVIKVVEILDNESMTQSSEITIPFIRKIFDEFDI